MFFSVCVQLHVCFRFKPGECILTVSEACWVTDDTYCYSHVVRTIGHIMAALRANVALPTSETVALCPHPHGGMSHDNTVVVIAEVLML